MPKPRKKWATSLSPAHPKRRHTSKAKAYEYVRELATERAAGKLRPDLAHVRVLVDEGSGRWQLFEWIVLDDLDDEGTRIMPKRRKLWSTSIMASGKTVRHESRTALDRYIHNVLRRDTATRNAVVDIFVDERDGRGPRLCERLNLFELTDEEA